MVDSNSCKLLLFYHIQRIGCHPEKTYFNAVANPARGLLNREKLCSLFGLVANSG